MNKLDLDNVTFAQAHKKLEQITTDKGLLTCNVCREQKFTIVDGWVNQTLQKDFKTFNIGGSSLPMVAVVCNNCGNTYYFNINALMAYGEKNGE